MHRVAGAAALAAGCPRAGAYGHVLPAAWGTADTARHQLGAWHAQVPACGPTPGAADTCGRMTKFSPSCPYLLAVCLGFLLHFWLPPPRTPFTPGHCFLYVTESICGTLVAQALLIGRNSHFNDHNTPFGPCSGMAACFVNKVLLVLPMVVAAFTVRVELLRRRLYCPHA